MKQHGVRCQECGDEIYSNSRHDCVQCECGCSFIDGGFDYIRVGFKAREPIQIARDIDRETLPRYFRNR